MHALRLGPGELGEVAIDLRERADQLERGGELADLLDGAIDEREPKAILHERAP